jgi:hypothetical protein
MRSIEEIKADIKNTQRMYNDWKKHHGSLETTSLAYQRQLVELDNELRAAHTADIPIPELEPLLTAYRKVGTVVYQIKPDLCFHRAHDKCDQYCDGWDTDCEFNHAELHVTECTFSMKMFDDLGKTVFLTREAAEKALEEKK